MPTEADEISVQISGKLEKVESFLDGNIVYFSMSQLMKLTDGQLDWEDVGLSISGTTENHKMIFFINSPYFKTDGVIKNMTYPAKLKKGQLYLPAVTFLPLYDDLRKEYVSWDKGSKSIRYDSDKYDITDASISGKANGILIEIFLKSQKEYEIFTSEGNWLNVSVPKTTVNKKQILTRKNKELLYDMNVFQLDGSSQISFQLRKAPGKYTHRFVSDPNRIQISIIDTSASLPISSGPKKVGPDSLIDKVIIDAGHGGSDYGAVGLKSSKEKEFVLDIAKRLGKLIKKDGIFEAIFTREKDESVTLADRTNIANEKRGDIFVSIHANASVVRKARGFQIFFLAPAKNDSARAAAQLENASFLAERNTGKINEQDNIDLILSDMIQTEFQSESAELASLIDKEMRKTIKETPDRGIDQAGFFVLNGAYMPSILVESAFITNRDDEKLLNNKDYRQKIAEAIYAGLLKFKFKYEKK
jgi:N-acetylmuramoyl-L-alanine amidase